MKVYEGSKKYIFVSYAHKDKRVVMPIIQALSDKGFRVWYDSGLEAGTEWPAHIAKHLKASDVVLTFLSDAFVQSRNCRNEVNLASSNQKTILAVYLKENVELLDGMDLQLASVHAIYKDRHDTFDSFIDELCRSSLLDGCRDGSVEPSRKDKPAPRREKKARRMNKTVSTLSGEAVIDFVKHHAVLVADLLFVLVCIICSLFLLGVRHYLIGAAIGVNYVLLWNYIRFTKKFNYTYLYLFVNAALLITCIPFLCFPPTLRAYAICLSAASALSSALLMIQAVRGMEEHKSRTNWGYVIEYEYCYGAVEHYAVLFTSEIAAILCIIGIALECGGRWPLRLVLGIGVFCISTLFVFIGCFLSPDYGTDGALRIVYTALYGGVGIAFWFISRTFAFWSIIAFAIAIVQFIFIFVMWHETEDNLSGMIAGIVIGVILAGVSVLVFFFAHHDIDFSIKGDTLVDYYGNEKVVYVPEEVKEIADDCFRHEKSKATLEEVHLESVEVIRCSAFRECHELRVVHLSANLKSIYSGAFSNCNIETIYFYGSEEEWNSVQKYDGNGSWLAPDWTDDTDFEVVFLPAEQP